MVLFFCRFDGNHLCCILNFYWTRTIFLMFITCTIILSCWLGLCAGYSVTTHLIVPVDCLQFTQEIAFYVLVYSLVWCCHTEWTKKLAQFVCMPLLYQILTDFQNFFTVRIRRKFVIRPPLKIPPHLVCRYITLWNIKCLKSNNWKRLL